MIPLWGVFFPLLETEFLTLYINYVLVIRSSARTKQCGSTHSLEHGWFAFHSQFTSQFQCPTGLYGDTSSVSIIAMKLIIRGNLKSLHRMSTLWRNFWLLDWYPLVISAGRLGRTGIEAFHWSVCSKMSWTWCEKHMENSGAHRVTLILLPNHQARQQRTPQLLVFKLVVTRIKTGISQLLQPKILPNCNGFWT